MRILDILKARKLGYQTLHNTTDMLLAKKVSGGSYEDVTVSGNPISITGAKGGLAKALTVDMLPIQDLHGYDKPWSGGSGKNKCEYSNATNPNKDKFSYTKDTDGDVEVEKTGSGGSFFARYLMKVEANTEYIFSFTQRLKDGVDVSQQIYIYSDELWGNAITNFGISGTTKRYNWTSSVTGTIVIGLYDGNAPIGTEIVVKGFMGCLSTATNPTTYEPYENICPISGRSSLDVTVNGLNIWDEQWEVGAINPQTGQNNVSQTGIRTKNYIPVLPETEYYVYVGISIQANLKARFYDKDKNYLGYTPASGQNVYYNSKFTTPQNCYYMRFSPQDTYGTVYNNDICINVSSSENGKYEPYKLIDTETIGFGETVYGGTCDVVNGGTSDEWEIVDLGTLNWNYNSTYNFFYASVSNIKPKTDKLTATIYEGIPTRLPSLMAQVDNNTVCTRNYDGNQIQIKDTRYVSASDFASAVSGVMFCYEKATPTTLTTPATPISLEKGNNTLSTSGDNMTVTYEGKGISSLQSGLSMMSPELTDMAEEDD